MKIEYDASWKTLLLHMYDYFDPELLKNLDVVFERSYMSQGFDYNYIDNVTTVRTILSSAPGNDRIVFLQIKPLTVYNNDTTNSGDFRYYIWKDEGGLFKYIDFEDVFNVSPSSRREFQYKKPLRAIVNLTDANVRNDNIKISMAVVGSTAWRLEYFVTYTYIDV